LAKVLKVTRIVLTTLLTLGLMTINTSLAHDPGAYLTWNREVSRVFYTRCANCHHLGGASFSMMTYAEVQPRLVAIKDQVLGRKMPPWGAVKGFGDFRNDQSLTQEEVELIAAWIDQDAPRGNNPNLLPTVPKFSKPTSFMSPKNSIQATDGGTVETPIVVDGVFPRKIGNASTVRIVAAFPNGHVEPLLWLYEYKDSIAHPFLYRTPIELPAGTVIHGVPQGADIILLPGRKPAKGK
jgi:hypothetical protein